MGYENTIFPRNTRFLVTGAAGFIGSNIAEALLRKGYIVRGLDNLSTGKRENMIGLTKYHDYEFIEGDIRDIKTCLSITENIDYVINQAALGSVPRSMEEPDIYEDNNVKGTANMMEASRLNHVRRFVYASSSSVYGDSHILPKKEGEEGNVLSPYALTKKVNESYGKLYTEIYGLECIGLRYFNVFGRRQDPYSQYAAVIPKFIKDLKNGRQVVIFGDGTQSRDFTYIENVIEANLKACLAPRRACGRSYNIAYGERLSVNRMYEHICKQLKISIDPVYTDPRPGDIKHSLADISNAKEQIGYSPDWNFSDGLTEAVEWYTNNL